MTPTASLTPDGRLRLADGTLDILVSADGSGPAVETAFKAAAGRFASLLVELAADAEALARPDATDADVAGLAGGRMVRATAAHAAGLAPAAAAGGAVADEILDAMTAAAPLAQAFVANGADLAIHLARGQTAHARVAARADNGGLVQLTAGDGIGGIATAGRRGRPYADGVADAVTVLATSAAGAAAAAALLAAAVDLPGHPAIERLPLGDVAPADGGTRLVVVGCLPLTEEEKGRAIARGARLARTMLADDRVRGVVIALQGVTRTLGWGNLVHGSRPPRPFRGRGARS